MRIALVLVLIACGPIYPAPPPTPTQTPNQSASTTSTTPQVHDDPVVPTAVPPTSDPIPLVSIGKPPRMGSSDEIAATMHWEGEEAYRRGKYDQASARFRIAVARVPEARYFYNLCASLYMEGKFTEALTSCNAVQRNNPTRDLVDKAAKLSLRVRDEARAQGITIPAP